MSYTCYSCFSCPARPGECLTHFWRAYVLMSNKATLKRLERLAQRRREPQDAFAEYQQKTLDNMTDDELARNLAALARVSDLVGLDDLVDEWTNED